MGNAPTSGPVDDSRAIKIIVDNEKTEELLKNALDRR